MPYDYDILTSRSDVLELRLQETRQLLLDSTSSDPSQPSTEAMQELEAMQTCRDQGQCEREWLRNLGETGEEGNRQTLTSSTTSKRARISVAPSLDLATDLTISSPSSRSSLPTIQPIPLPTSPDTSQKRRNRRSRNRPARVISKLAHADKKAKENLQELPVQIGRHDGSLEDGTLTSIAKRQGETGKRRTTQAPVGAIDFIGFDPSHSATRGLSKFRDVLFVRAGQPPPGFVDTVNTFARDLLARPDLRCTANSSNTRSNEVQQLIIGTSRSYSMKFGFTGTFKQHPQLVEYILHDDRLKRIVTYVNQLLHVHYPKVYERYRAANPGDTSPFRSRFGVYPQMCFNWTESGRGATSKMHPDAKNPAGGICCVIASGHFDSSNSFFLYFKELGKALELPTGVPIFFPSALFLHGNINRPNVVEAKDERKVLDGQGIPRGSLVFFAQADWLSLAEKMAGIGREVREGGVYTGLSSIFRS